MAKPKFLPLKDAPRDGTMLRLLVRFTEHPMDDDNEPQITIGMNNKGNTGVDEWRFAGWCWTQDVFTQGYGEVLGWLPLLDNLVSKS